MGRVAPASALTRARPRPETCRPLWTAGPLPMQQRLRGTALRWWRVPSDLRSKTAPALCDRQVPGRLVPLRAAKSWCSAPGARHRIALFCFAFLGAGGPDREQQSEGWRSHRAPWGRRAGVRQPRVPKGRYTRTALALLPGERTLFRGTRGAGLWLRARPSAVGRRRDPGSAALLGVAFYRRVSITRALGHRHGSLGGARTREGLGARAEEWALLLTGATVPLAQESPAGPT